MQRLSRSVLNSPIDGSHFAAPSRWGHPPNYVADLCISPRPQHGCCNGLTPNERREIELAENLNRNDLTPVERSRQMVALAETAAEVPSKTVLLHDESKPANGRPPVTDSERRVAERIGVSQPTLNRAKQHVAATDAYPELTPYPQTDALKFAAKLDAMPEPRPISRARSYDAPGPSGGMQG